MLFSHVPGLARSRARSFVASCVPVRAVPRMVGFAFGATFLRQGATPVCAQPAAASQPADVPELIGVQEDLSADQLVLRAMNEPRNYDQRWPSDVNNMIRNQASLRGVRND